MKPQHIRKQIAKRNKEQTATESVASYNQVVSFKLKTLIAGLHVTPPKRK